MAPARVCRLSHARDRPVRVRQPRGWIYRGAMKRVVVWVVCCGAGALLGHGVGRLFALAIPDCTGTCLLPYPSFEELARVRIVRSWTFLGFAMGMAVAVAFHLWSLWRATRDAGRIDTR